MKSGFPRRRFLQGLAGTAVVVSWSPLAQSWVTEPTMCDFAEMPPLDGEFRIDTTTRTAFADDFGNIVSREPCAVLVPGSVEDIVKIVRFARRHGLRVAMNGQSGTPDLRESHSNFGQAQVKAGVVIDAKPLSTIQRINTDSAVVEAGVLWSQLFDAAAERGLTPPVLTDYMHLSIGGTLSVGGIGGSTSRFGVQADNVLALKVVTGEGNLVTCPPTQSPNLFHAVLAGVGQCGIIVGAKIRLIAAETMAMVFNLFYDDLSLYLQDQLTLLADRRFNYLEGQIVRNATDTGWRYMIEAAAYFTPPAAPDSVALLAGLHDNRPEARITPQTYRDFAFRVDPIVEFLKAIGRWTTSHPWVSLFIPASKTAGFISNLVATLTPEDLGVLAPGVLGPALLYPFNTNLTQQRLFRIPNEPAAFHLNLLRFPPSDPAQVAAMLAQNRALYGQAVALGGKRYVIGAIPNFTHADWQQHFQPEWNFLINAKNHFDPDNVLTPGQGIFH
ncbi:MAG: FAD-binding protein [Gammaproteobacteria bacterium]|nr:FAD-binding protein [Gammaproteobacteria bacterium]